MASPAKPNTKVCRERFLWAAYDGTEGMVKELLQLPGINLKIKDDISGRTPLMWAAVAGQEGMVKLLFSVPKRSVRLKLSTAAKACRRPGNRRVERIGNRQMPRQSRQIP